MKIKFLSILFCVTLLIPFYSCNTSKQQSNNVSQLRSNVFYGEQNDIKIKVFAEEKEYPFINDGIANERQNFVTIKVLNNDQLTKVYFSYDKQSYSSTCEYNVYSMSMDCSVKVKSLPAKSILVKVEINNSIIEINCQSQLKSDTISPLNALEKVTAIQQDFISTLYKDGKFNAEIYIRLIVENGYNFYYVGFAQGQNKITAFLLDGKTGEIIAGKN